MPQPTRVGDQWKRCDRCDILTPLARLAVEDGLALCDRPGCRDGYKQDEYHLLGIARVLNKPTRELEDRRSDIYFRGDNDVDNN